MKSVKLVQRVVPAPLWKRIVSHFIDVALISFIILLPLDKSLKVSSTSFFQAPVINNSVFLLGIFAVLLSLAYWVILEYKLQQSVGKILMKLYVHGKQLPFSHILVRNLTKPFSLLLLIDVLYMFFKGGHQRLFETFSDTDVVEVQWILK
ncbi:RDD family protein [Candidatus Woesearchaeota archaeon]|nr:RDD family protein [Candidatus Woesearchaeota archaeon]